MGDFGLGASPEWTQSRGDPAMNARTRENERSKQTVRFDPRAGHDAMGVEIKFGD